MRIIRKTLTGLAMMAVMPFTLSAQTLVVKPTTPIAPIQPTMYGIFFEDINFGADGGIYAEMVKNRSFEFQKPLMGWVEEGRTQRHGQIRIMNREDALSANPRYCQIIHEQGKQVTLTNEGFRGMGFKANLRYDFSVLARQASGISVVKIELLNAKQEAIGSTELKITGEEWATHTASLTSSTLEPQGSLRLTFTGTGTLDFDMVSMFPSDTWKNRPRGLRADLVQLLADMKPGFLRFPGGCIVEGHDLALRYQWKKTIGNIEDREMIKNRWNDEFAHRLTPDYYQTFGLGFYEYFLLSEDLGAQPLPIVSCGIACQFNTGELVPMCQLEPYIQDALDLIEFANGPVTSVWGKKRADMGHPEPFNMKYIGVGNEQWGPQYIERYIEFEKAIKAKYPEIIIVSGSGPFPDGGDFEYAWQELVKLNAPIIDEHYYHSPEWFLSNAKRYDQYDRKGPKVFAGEYAVQTVGIASPLNKNSWKAALAEAAFMTGLERNAEVVHLTSYAPLFAHVDAWQWTPDMIWFDNLKAMGTPNYYVQKMYSTNAGTAVVPMLLNGQAVTGQDGLYATAAIDEKSNEIILKVVNASDSEKQLDVVIDGVKKLSSKANGWLLTAQSDDAVNSVDNPTNIAPEPFSVKTSGKKVPLTLKGKSFIVLRIQK
jgi:alpha-L-arabinofuranosidase